MTLLETDRLRKKRLRAGIVGGGKGRKTLSGKAGGSARRVGAPAFCLIYIGQR